MNTELRQSRIGLVRAVALLTVKLLIGAGRDIVLTPIVLAAAAIDFIMLKSQPPRFFRQLLRFGQWSDEWIDTWSFGREPHEAPRENVEALLARVEDVVRDPKQGTRHARVLKRWAERQMNRAKQKITPTDPGKDLEPRS
jgi:hypothetical protein